MHYKLEINGFKNYGYLAAVDPQYTITMSCNKCKTKWLGCWDDFECPECNEGQLLQLDTELLK